MALYEPKLYIYIYNSEWNEKIGKECAYNSEIYLKIHGNEKKLRFIYIIYIIIILYINYKPELLIVYKEICREAHKREENTFKKITHLAVFLYWKAAY